jgi:hypothetical protein
MQLIQALVVLARYPTLLPVYFARFPFVATPRMSFRWLCTVGLLLQLLSSQPPSPFPLSLPSLIDYPNSSLAFGNEEADNVGDRQPAEGDDDGDVRHLNRESFRQGEFDPKSRAQTLPDRSIGDNNHAMDVDRAVEGRGGSSSSRTSAMASDGDAIGNICASALKAWLGPAPVTALTLSQGLQHADLLVKFLSLALLQTLFTRFQTLLAAILRNFSCPHEMRPRGVAEDSVTGRSSSAPGVLKDIYSKCALVLRRAVLLNS